MTRDEAVRYAFAELHQTFFDELHALMAKVDARARAEEREACAKVCDEIETDNWDKYKGREYDEIIWRADAHVQGVSCGANDCAAAIRARGEK